MSELPKSIPGWNAYQKIGFRFVLLFFILFIVLLDWSAIPLLSTFYYYGNLALVLDSLVNWMGHELLGISGVIVSPYDAEHNDRTYVYLLYGFIVSVAVLGTIVWSWFDRKRTTYKVLYYWFTVVLRYYLAFTMFLFALYKFFKLQFPDLDYYTLTSQVGDLSPMHLAWAFFGYSYGYNVFMGLAECAGLLLLFRRTTTLGALLVIGALANVIAVNYHFDVHAKLYPTVLIAMALVLVARDLKKILVFFLTGRSVALQKIEPPVVPKSWVSKLLPLVKFLIIAYFLVSHIKDNIAYKKYEVEQRAFTSKYAGVYDVNLVLLNKDTLASDHPQAWRQLVIGDRILDAVRLKGDSIAYASLKTEEQELLLSGDQSDLFKEMQKIYNELGLSDQTYERMDSILAARKLVDRFHIGRIDSTSLFFKGIIDNDSIGIRAKRRPIVIANFRLMKRRFHWINEASYFY